MIITRKRKKKTKIADMVFEKNCLTISCPNFSWICSGAADLELKTYAWLSEISFPENKKNIFFAASYPQQDYNTYLSMLMFTSVPFDRWYAASQIFAWDVAGYTVFYNYQRLNNSKFSPHVYRPRKLKIFEAVAWPPPIARKPRTDARFIANTLLFSVVRNARLVSCDGQLSLEHPSGAKFVNFPQV